MDEQRTPARARVATAMAEEGQRLIDSLDDAQRKLALFRFRPTMNAGDGSIRRPTTAG